ncbi:hypothetical protein ACFWZ2_11665 [Streptomyces sp. NPDC059002]|uniref:hypothetical protein n=1 Tax=Streptomyces sp. NPDC059002 TaxID=3346690 RepID=UPI0036A21AB7
MMGHEGPYVQLRPPGGGREWDAKPENVRLADENDRLRASIVEVRLKAARTVGMSEDEPAVPLPDPATLNNLQLTEQACVLCGKRLFRDRFLSTVAYMERGRKVTAQLWACAPDCDASATTPRPPTSS